MDKRKHEEKSVKYADVDSNGPARQELNFVKKWYYAFDPDRNLFTEQRKADRRGAERRVKHMPAHLLAEMDDPRKGDRSHE